MVELCAIHRAILEAYVRHRKSDAAELAYRLKVEAIKYPGVCKVEPLLSYLVTDANATSASESKELCHSIVLFTIDPSLWLEVICVSEFGA